MQWNNVQQTPMLLNCIGKLKKSGAEPIEVHKKGSARIVEFYCSACREQWHITYDQMSKNINPNFLCSSCLKKERSENFGVQSYEELKEEFFIKGSELLTPSPINTHSVLEFKCSVCSQPHKIKFGDYRRGRNQNLLCLNCSQHPNYTISFIKREFEKAGLKLLSEEYVNNESPLFYLCPECGEKASITWSYFRADRSTYLCSKCQIHAKPTLNFLKGFFSEKGAELLSTSYINCFTPLEFRCSLCGEKHHITYAKLGKKNKRLLCPKCMKGGLVNPEGSGTAKRSNLENYWRSWILGFFNVPFDIKVSSHHIFSYFAFPEYRVSIPNGFPVISEYHSVSYVDENGIQNPMHYREEMLNPENWPLAIKLPYHNYEHFRFINLNSFMLTQVILSEEDSVSLLKKKTELSLNGIFYIPFFLEETFEEKREQLMYSMIRARLYRYLGEEIYKYTGQKFNKFFARKCEVRKLSVVEEQSFFDITHIQGYVRSKVCYGLFYNRMLVAAMSFGVPRVSAHKGDNHWELLRFSVQLNTMVVGGAGKLFSSFIKDYSPDYIISYCDIRFSSVNPEDTLYPKLGFVYDGKTSPNYKYTHPEMNRLFSRQSFQKWKLEKKLENFDPNLSEYENMKNNGYYRLYDCGNFRFIWRKP